jgi:predicted RNA-binding Zn ribbon-like protein
VDFVRYAEASASLVNAELADRDDLVRHLAARAWLHEQCTERDATVLRKFQRDLRPVFEASDVGDRAGVIDGLNELMERHPITPRISDHDPDDLHLHVANRAASVADLLIGESLLGLATLVCDLGPNRLGVCSASPCTNVYVDTSPNQSRRYCSDRCSSRANVAAYRARQKVERAAAATAEAAEAAGTGAGSPA